jgi:hypothetical protein
VPFAVASDGTMYMNVARFEGLVAADILLHRAMMEPGSLFIGVALTPEEVQGLLQAVARATGEASTQICSARMWAKGRQP